MSELLNSDTGSTYRRAGDLFAYAVESADYETAADSLAAGMQAKCYSFVGWTDDELDAAARSAVRKTSSRALAENLLLAAYRRAFPTPRAAARAALVTELAEDGYRLTDHAVDRCLDAAERDLGGYATAGNLYSVAYAKAVAGK